MKKRQVNSAQMLLFDYVTEAYKSSTDGVLDNERLYRNVAQQAGITLERLEEKVPVGQLGQEHNLLKRQIRWHQQTLKHLGLIERADNTRGLWRLTKEGKLQLRRAEDDVGLLAFATDLGIAIFGSCRRTFSRLNEPIHLVVTSPPYPLRKPRAYGNPSHEQYNDFLCECLEPIVANLVPGGSIALNVSNDIFEQGSPARSLYLERLTIALHDRLGLSLMDRIIWQNPSKPPGPVQWASKERVQLNVSYEPVLWFTNDPHQVRADNRRVLEQHTERHLRLITNGGEHRTATYSDGAYSLKEGNFGRKTSGRIPRNILTYGHNCADARQYRKDAATLGLPVHGAPMPLSLPDFLIRFLTQPGDLVADPFGGKFTTAKAAENLGRRWFSTEWIMEYIRASAERFRSASGFWLNPIFDSGFDAKSG